MIDWLDLRKAACDVAQKFFFHSPELIEDIAQEVLTCLWRRVDKLPSDPHELHNYAARVARNCCVNHIRNTVGRYKTKKFKTVQMPDHFNRLAPEIKHDDLPPKLLDVLSSRERQAIVLFYLQQRPMTAVQQAMGLTKFGVSSLLSLARKRMRGGLTRKDWRAQRRGG